MTDFSIKLHSVWAIYNFEIQYVSFAVFFKKIANNYCEV